MVNMTLCVVFQMYWEFGHFYTSYVREQSRTICEMIENNSKNSYNFMVEDRPTLNALLKSESNFRKRFDYLLSDALQSIIEVEVSMDMDNKKIEAEKRATNNLAECITHQSLKLLPSQTKYNLSPSGVKAFVQCICKAIKTMLSLKKKNANWDGINRLWKAQLRGSKYNLCVWRPE